MTFLRWLVSFVLVALGIGYIVYILAVAGMNADPQARADAIVALTGGQGQRVETALRLLEEDRGERLLISGVFAGTTAEDIRAMAPADATRFDCCVDFDRVADDTAGNARETAIWARENGYRRILLVTHAYHMPRARLELQRASPGVTFVPYPVGDWSEPGLRRTAVEYAKLLVILGREAVLRLRGLPG